MNKEYLCECGKVCTTPSSLGGHKRHCKVYLESVGKLEHMQKADSLIATHYDINKQIVNQQITELLSFITIQVD